MKKKLIALILILITFYFLYKLFFGSTVENTFPFSNADDVELVFYRTTQTGGVDLKKFNKIPIKKKIKLNDDEKTEIFQILYKENCIIQTSAACYDPKHALLFTKQNDTIGLIEVCLECSQIRVTEGIKKPIMCDGMIINLDKFFKEKE
jgi:hypothetical protein